MVPGSAAKGYSEDAEFAVISPHVHSDAEGAGAGLVQLAATSREGDHNTVKCQATAGYLGSCRNYFFSVADWQAFYAAAEELKKIEIKTGTTGRGSAKRDVIEKLEEAEKLWASLLAAVNVMTELQTALNKIYDDRARTDDKKVTPEDQAELDSRCYVGMSAIMTEFFRVEMAVSDSEKTWHSEDLDYGDVIFGKALLALFDVVDKTADFWAKLKGHENKKEQGKFWLAFSWYRTNQGGQGGQVVPDDDAPIDSFKSLLTMLKLLRAQVSDEKGINLVEDPRDSSLHYGAFVTMVDSCTPPLERDTDAFNRLIKETLEEATWVDNRNPDLPVTVVNRASPTYWLYRKVGEKLPSAQNGGQETFISVSGY
eukprot:CAMPEP_0178402446 /NCGR_PEP_ID=MMETSP0689_2-20121128/16846_1 /TAXON_ID=160604 /ORGANISM="Amphidinium massartii, Strain CS-259" /LENGTH=368 /DNA_ID=CAMNT_0020023347 /DNA_START=177 /DNA_END=1284 /DNA_ORIENTATION=+